MKDTFLEENFKHIVFKRNKTIKMKLSLGPIVEQIVISSCVSGLQELVEWSIPFASSPNIEFHGSINLKDYSNYLNCNSRE